MLSWPDMNTLRNGDDCGEMVFMCPVQVEESHLSLVNQFYLKDAKFPALI